MQIVFPDLPDEPRKQSTASRSTAPRVEVTPSPKPINYGQPTGQKLPYVGYVTNWADKIVWGRRSPGPHELPLRCWAVSEAHARYILCLQANRQGYALGGVKNIHVDQECLTKFNKKSHD